MSKVYELQMRLTTENTREALRTQREKREKGL